jgi:hypothetical protein
MSQLLSETWKQATSFFQFPTKQKIPTITKVEKPVPVEKKEEDKLSYKASQEMMQKKMTNTEMYNMASRINNLPLELLGEIIKITMENKQLNPNETHDIPFTSFDNSILRTIEAYLNEAEKRVKMVKKMHMKDTLPASEQLTRLNEILAKVTNTLKEQSINPITSDGTTMDGTTTGSEYEEEEETE